MRCGVQDPNSNICYIVYTLLIIRVSRLLNVVGFVKRHQFWAWVRKWPACLVLGIKNNYPELFDLQRKYFTFLFSCISDIWVKLPTCSSWFGSGHDIFIRCWLKLKSVGLVWKLWWSIILYREMKDLWWFSFCFNYVCHFLLLTIPSSPRIT